MVGRDRGPLDEYLSLIKEMIRDNKDRTDKLEDELNILRTQVWAAVGALVAVLVGIVIKIAFGGP